jgi:hypothetical protein
VKVPPLSPRPERVAAVMDADLSQAAPDCHHHFRSVHHMYRASPHRHLDLPRQQTCSVAASAPGRLHDQIHHSKIAVKLIFLQNSSPKCSEVSDLAPT